MPRGFLGLFKKRVDCDEIHELASDYLDTDLSEEEREWIQKHLEMCMHCHSFMDTLRSTITMLGDLPSKPMPDSLKEKLRQIPSRRESGQG